MTHSEELFSEACLRIPGGVNSPVRAFGSVDGSPVFFASANGSRVTDVDDNAYVDLCMSWGPLIVGHAHPSVITAVQSAATRGLSFGACHRGEIELAQHILGGFSWADQVRLVSSGTEAVMTAVRLARGVTKRPYVVKFEGGYHGHVDPLLVKAGSGLVTSAIANSAGIPETTAKTTLVAPLDDLDATAALFAKYGSQIAAVIIEPMPANNGLLIQQPAFLKGLRQLCTQAGALLIFDEVISGFRLHYGGYGELVGVQPDLVTLGKIVGGGMPIGAVVGPKDIMGHLAPLGPVYQAGTLSGNPISVAAGQATLALLRDGSAYNTLDALGQAFVDRVASHNLKNFQVQRAGSVVWLYLSKQPLPTRADAIDSAITERFRPIHSGLLKRGYYLPPSAYEVCFLSTAHTRHDVTGLADALAEISMSTA